MTIKELDNQKTINFNPIFIFYELSNVLRSESSASIFINIIFLGFIVLIFYCFFDIELIFLYNFVFNKIDKTKKETELEDIYYKKLEDIFTSKVECIDGNTMIVKKNGTKIQAKNLKGENIGKIPFCQTVIRSTESS